MNTVKDISSYLESKYKLINTGYNIVQGVFWQFIFNGNEFTIAFDSGKIKIDGKNHEHEKWYSESYDVDSLTGLTEFVDGRVLKIDNVLQRVIAKAI